jgi:signal transduction histidine kinase
MAARALIAPRGKKLRTRRPISGRGALWLIWALVMIMLAATGYAAVEYLRTSALSSARRDMANMSIALAEQTARTIQSVDLVLRDIQTHTAELGVRTPEQFRDQMAGEGVQRLLAGRLRNLPQAEALALVDAEGMLLNWSRDIPVRQADLSDRDYYQHLRDHGETGIYVSGPKLGRTSHKPLVLIVRRIDAPDGAMLGLVVGVIDAKYLEGFYQKVSMQPGQAVTLLNRDGVVIAGYPELGDWWGKRMPVGSAWYQQVQQGGGTYDASDYLGGRGAIVAVRPLSDLPLVVDVSVTMGAALASWHRDAFDVVIIRAGVALVFTALFCAISRLFRQQEGHARELARVAERLRASERQVRDFAEISSDWFWEQDADLRFVWLSKTALLNTDDTRSYVGLTRWELAGSDGTDPPWPEHIADLAARKPFRDFRFQLRAPDGSGRYISASGLPIYDEAGIFIGYHGTACDVTAQVQVQEELRRSKEAAEAASRAKSEFLANMSHELRTPLNAIIGFSELMQKQRSGRAGEAYMEWAGDIMASGRHLLDVINEVLELARIEAGRYALAQDRVDLGTAVRACLAMVKLQAEAKRVRLECGIAEREVLLRADARAVRQIVLNLLTNAVKFTPSGGTVVISGGRAANGDVMLAVADTGIGIDSAALPSLGQPFTQADASISRTYGGTGLGLSISRKLAAMHGGELTIESHPGQGTTVRVVFPAVRVLAGGQVPALMSPSLEPTVTD